MKQTDGAKKQLELLLQRYPILAGQRDEIDGAYQIIAASYEAGGKLLVAGNGGSAADAEHIVGELMKGFKKTRRLDEALAERLLRESPELGPDLVQHLQKALPAIAMDGHPALTTAYANDCAPLMCFAQQVNGYGRAGDVLLVISTSGKSKNILYAAVTARALGMKVVGLTGGADSPLLPLLVDQEVYPENLAQLAVARRPPGAAARHITDTGASSAHLSLPVPDAGRTFF